MQYHDIKNPADAKAFIEAVNGLHDGYILSVHYANNGVSREDRCLYFAPDRTELRVTVLVTSIWDSMVELVFESVEKWQMEERASCLDDIFDVLVEFDANGSVIWTTGFSTEPKVLKENRYVIAKSMKWRFIEDHRPQE